MLRLSQTCNEHLVKLGGGGGGGAQEIYHGEFPVQLAMLGELGCVVELESGRQVRGAIGDFFLMFSRGIVMWRLSRCDS